MEGQGNSAMQEGGMVDSTTGSAENLVSAKDSEAAVIQPVQISASSSSATQTDQKSSASDKNTSEPSHRPTDDTTPKIDSMIDVNVTSDSTKSNTESSNHTESKMTENVPKNDSANIQGLQGNHVLETVENQDSPKNIQCLEVDSTSEGGNAVPCTGQPENDVPTCSEQTVELKNSNINKTESTVPSEHTSDADSNASQNLVSVKGITETSPTEGSIPMKCSVNSVKEMSVAEDTTATDISDKIVLVASNTLNENNTLHAVLESSMPGIEHEETSVTNHQNTARTQEVAEESISNEDKHHSSDSIKSNSVQQSPSEQNFDVKESPGAIDSKECTDQIETSKEGIVGTIEQGGAKKFVEENDTGQDVLREDGNENSSSQQVETLQETTSKQDESVDSQEEILPSCKEGAKEDDKEEICVSQPDQSEDGKLTTNAISEEDTEIPEEEETVFPEKTMTADDLADISEFDSTAENVTENVTLNSATEAENSEGQMDNLTFETATEDGNPESSESSLEAPTCNLDLGLPTLEMPLGENGISMYSDGDDSQHSLKKSRPEVDLEKDTISNGKDSIKDKKEEEKLEDMQATYEQQEREAPIVENLSEDLNKAVDLSFKLENLAKGEDCKEGQPMEEGCLEEMSSDIQNGSYYALDLSDSNQNKTEPVANSVAEESTLSSVETPGPMDLTKGMNGTNGAIVEQGTLASGTWPLNMPTVKFTNKRRTAEIMSFWRSTFQCKYCSFHAQNEADMKLHTQQKHSKGKETNLVPKKDATETTKQEGKPDIQDQTLPKEEEVFPKEETKRENGSKEEKIEHHKVEKVPDKDKKTEDITKTEKTGSYKCALCPYQSTTIKGRCGHMASHAKKVKCSKCGFLGRSVKELQKHMIKDHKSSNSTTLGTTKKNTQLAEAVKTNASSKVSPGKQAVSHKARKSMSPPAKSMIFNNVESEPGEEQHADVTRVFINHKTYPNSCPYCPHSSVSLPELQAHVQCHQAASGLPCNFCSYKANNETSLMSHMEVHYAGFAYKCNHCGFLSPTQEQALLHFEATCKDKPRIEPSSPSKKQRTAQSKGQKSASSGKSETSQDTTGDASDDSDIVTILQEPPKYSYKCPHCPFTVTGKAKLNLHIAGHSKEDGIQCSQCSYRASTAAKLSKHMRVHQLIGRFKCKHCRFWSVYKDRVKQHLQNECKVKAGDGKREQKDPGKTWTSTVDETNSDIVSMVKDPNQYPHRCPHCPFSSASPTQIGSHVARHFGQEGVQCNECTFRAISDGMLRKHKRVHQKLGKYKCRYCTYWSWYRDSVLTHLQKCKLNPGRMSTETEEEEEAANNAAKEKAESKAKRESYSRWDDSDDEEIVVKVKKVLRSGHKCPHCPFVASNVGKLSIHLPNHSRVDGVQCNKCTFKASTEQLLGFHKRVHQRGVRTYHCVHCSYWSWYKDRVQLHLENGCTKRPKADSTTIEQKSPGKKQKKESTTKMPKKDAAVDEDMSTMQEEADDKTDNSSAEDANSALSKHTIQVEGEEELPGQEERESSKEDEDIVVIEQDNEPRYGLKCPHCPLTTASADSYQQHLARHEMKEGIKCSKCSFRALTAGRLQVHNKVHAKKFMYKCRHCGFLAETREDVTHHLTICVKKVKRDVVASNTKASDEVVVRRRTRQYSMNCPHCPYTTGNSKCMKTHQARHQNQDGMRCDRCSFNALSPGKLAKHMKVHQTGGGYKCKYCPYFSGYRGQVLQHLRVCKDKLRALKEGGKGGKEEEVRDLSKMAEAQDNEVEEDEIGVCLDIEVLKSDTTLNYKHKCPYCPHSALTPTSLEPHIQRHFINEGPKCKFCTYRALNASGLYGHERLHWKGCFKCKHCPYIAPHRRLVLEHLKQCPSYCNVKQFVGSPDIAEVEEKDMHVLPTSVSPDAQSEGKKRKNPGDLFDRDVVTAYKKQTLKQHKCPHCPYSASGPALLEPHVVRHLDTGSGFKCDLCNYRAASLGWLNNHRKVHQDGLFFKCRYCTFWSPVRDEVVSHVAKKHHMGSEDKKMKVDGPVPVETTVAASQINSSAGPVARTGTPSLMDTVKRLGEALSSAIPLVPEANRTEDVQAVLSSQDKATQEALKRKEGGSSDRNLKVTLKKKKTENGEAIWQTEDSRICPYKECMKKFDSASAFVTHLAEHTGAGLTQNATSSHLPGVKTVQQQPSIPPPTLPSQPILPGVRLPQHVLQQQAGVAPLRHPALIHPQQQLAMFQPQQPLLQQQQQRPLQLMTSNPTAPPGLVRPPVNVGANQPAVLGQGQAASQQNRQVFLVSGLQQNLGGFALFVPYSSGGQSAASGSVVTSVAHSPHTTQASSVSPSTGESPNFPSPLAQPPQRPSSTESYGDKEFDFLQHVTHTWRGDLLCKYCSYATQHRNVMSRHVKKHLHPSGDDGKEEVQQTQSPTASSLQQMASTPSSEGLAVRRASVSPPFSSATPPPHFDVLEHITEDWGSRLLSCKYCDFSTTAKNIMSRHVKKHLPQGMAGSNSRKTPDNVGTTMQEAEKQTYTSDTGVFDLSKHATENWRGDYSCNHCGYVAQFKQIMSRHVKQHLQAGKSPKAATKAMSFQELTLTDHIRITTLGERTLYTCRYCDYQATFKSHVSRHVKKHLALGVPEATPSTVTTSQPSTSVSPATSAAQSQPEVSALPESSDGCRGASPSNRSSTASPSENMAGVDVEGRWWTTKFRCKHCSFSTRFKHQIEEHMRTHYSPPNTQQGQQQITTPTSPTPSHDKASTTQTVIVHPPYSTISPPLQRTAVNSSPNVAITSPPNTIVSARPPAVNCSPHVAPGSPPTSIVNAPPPAVNSSQSPAIMVSPPPVPSSPLTASSSSGSDSSATASLVNTSVGKGSVNRRFVYYQCKFCPFTAQYKEAVTQHASEQHPGETPPLTNQGTPYKCPLCPYYTQSNTALQVHVRRHENRDFPYICTHCKFAGASREDLAEHSRKHTAMGRGSGRIRNLYLTIFKCPYCTFTSRVSTLMQTHLATWHATNTVFCFCFKCDLEFATTEEMDRHMHLYHGGRATTFQERYRRGSPNSTSASPAISSEGSQVDDSEPLPLLWKPADRQAVENVEGQDSMLSPNDRKEEGRTPPSLSLSLSQTDDSDVEFVCETGPTNNIVTNTQEQQRKEDEDVTTRGDTSNDTGVVTTTRGGTSNDAGVVTTRGSSSNDAGVVSSSQEKTTVQEDLSALGREHISPRARSIRSGSVPDDDDDDDVMPSPPSSPDLKAVTDLMEELSDSEIISEDSTDPFGQHHSSQLETSPVKTSSGTISEEGATAEKASKDLTDDSSGRPGQQNGECDSAVVAKGGNDMEKPDSGGNSLMVSRVHPLQSGLVGTVEQATRSSLPGQQSWPSLKSTSSDFQASGTSTQSEGTPGRGTGTDVGRQVKGTALVACVSVSPQTNTSASVNNNRSELEGTMSGGSAAGYRCNHCGVRFGDFLMYSIHGGFHQQENPFTCNICKHTASDRYQFNLHFTSAKHASLTDTSPLGAMAASLGALSRGGAVPNSTSDPTQPGTDQGYYCIHCSMTFDDFLLYSIHSGFHSQQHPFMCNICGQDCGDRYQFVIHFAKADHS